MQWLVIDEIRNKRILCSVIVFVIGLAITPVALSEDSKQRIVRTCPTDFVHVAKKCYFFSKDTATFHSANYDCLARNSSLAVISKPSQEKQIRNYLNKHEQDIGRYPRWIGATFDWKQTQWIWSNSGKPVIFNAFVKMNQCKDWSWQCAIIDPERDNYWYAKKCFEETQYICQTKGTVLLTNTRQKKDFNISSCNDTRLSSLETKKCFKMLHNSSHNNQSPGFLTVKPTKPRKPRKIYICPPYMILVKNKCYYFSTDELSFYEAHFACLENHTKLAVIKNAIQDKHLRQFLNNNFVERAERWLGGMYDWKKNRWSWLMNGEQVDYKGFTPQVLNNQSLYWVGIIMDPSHKNQWNVRNVSERKKYICQRKAKTIPYQGAKINNEPLPEAKFSALKRKKDRYKINYL